MPTAPGRLRKRAVLGIAAIALTLGALTGLVWPATTAADSGPELVRVAGSDRVETALEAARTAFPESADAAVLATAADFPDALAAGTMAADVGGPLLLLPERLTEGVGSGLDDLGVGEVHLAGGVGAIAYLAETDLTAAGLEVHRTAGENRWDTAALLARSAEAPETDEVVVAAGTDFPDAVSAAALAAAHRLPVLLTRPDRLPADSAAAVDALSPSRTTVVGGQTAVSDDVLGDLPDPVRLAGPERTATSVAIAEEVLDRGGTLDEVVVASARSFPDALSAGSLAAALNAPVLLVEPDPEQVGAAVDMLAARRSEVERVLVVGGPAAVPDAVLAVLEDVLREAADEDGDAEDGDGDVEAGDDAEDGDGDVQAGDAGDDDG